MRSVIVMPASLLQAGTLAGNAIAAKINQTYATDVNITLVFDNPTLSDQAEALPRR